MVIARATLVAATSALYLVAQAGAACTLDKVASLYVATDHHRITVAGQIDGRPIQFLVDTAMPHSFILAPAAETMGLPTVDLSNIAVVRPHDGGKPVGTVDLKDLQIGSLHVGPARLYVNGQRQSFGDGDLVAVLGIDFLGQYDVELNLPGHQITLYLHQPEACRTANLAYWGGHNAAVAFDSDDGLPWIAAKVNGKVVAAILDSGAPYSTLTNRTAEMVGASKDGSGADWPDSVANSATAPTDYFTLAHELGTFEPGQPGVPLFMRDSHSYEGAVHPPSWLVSVDSFAVGDVVARPAVMPVQLFPSPMQSGMLVGVDFMLSHRVMIAFSQRRLFVGAAG